MNEIISESPDQIAQKIVSLISEIDELKQQISVKDAQLSNAAQ